MQVHLVFYSLVVKLAAGDKPTYNGVLAALKDIATRGDLLATTFKGEMITHILGTEALAEISEGTYKL